MIPLLFAAALTIAPAAAQPGQPTPVINLSVPASQIHRFRIPQPPTAIDCAAKFATRTSGPDGAPLKKLGDLPPGLLEHAVLRSIGGCAVREIVSGGETHYLAGSEPSIQSVDPVIRPSKQR